MIKIFSILRMIIRRYQKDKKFITFKFKVTINNVLQNKNFLHSLLLNKNSYLNAVRTKRKYCCSNFRRDVREKKNGIEYTFSYLIAGIHLFQIIKLKYFIGYLSKTLSINLEKNKYMVIAMCTIQTLII